MLTISIESGDHGTKLRLSGQLRIESVLQAKPGLLDAVAAHDDLEFELSAVDGLDAAGVQLLLLAKREATRLGHQLRLVAHSPNVVELFELYQLAGHFGDPIVLPAPSAGARA